MKKKILIFSVAYSPFWGGAEIAVKEITDRLSIDFDFEMLTVNLSGAEKKEEQIGNIFVRRICKSKIVFVFYAFIKAISLHYKNNYSATWSIMANYAGFSAMFFKLFYREVPFILTLQEGDPIPYIRKKVGIFYPWFSLIFKKANIIQVITNYLADWAREEGAKCPVVVVPNGANLEKFASEKYKAESRKLRSEFGFEEGDKILITASRLVEKNGIADIINSLKYLENNIKIIIAGKGELENVLKKITHNLGFEERVKFVGEIKHEKLPELLSISDVFIRPSLSEGFGNAFIEAMAMRVPVIATKVGGIPDFLKEEETGLFCDINSPRSIAQKVEKLLKDKESRDYIVENAYKMVIEKYDWNLIAKDMKEKVFDAVRD